MFISLFCFYLCISIWFYLLSSQSICVSFSLCSLSPSLYLYSLVPSPHPICTSVSPFNLSYLSVFILSSRFTLFVYKRGRGNIPISGFSATHTRDIKILPNCMSSGDPKTCDNKIEAVLNKWTISTYTRIEGWISGSHTKCIQSHTHSKNSANLSRALYRHTHIRIYIPMVNSQPFTYVYTRTYIHAHIHVLNLFIYQLISTYI